MRILIAEDNSLTSLGISMIVERLGHEVIGISSDGQEAIKQAIEQRPDLILMDINMPKKNGLEALEEINKAVSIPCIFITAYSDEAFIKGAAHLNAIGYVTKPVSEAQLKAQIELGIHQQGKLRAARAEAFHYKQALSERKLVERAKGILMDRLGIKEAEAMHRLQKKCRDQGKKIAVVAEEIINADKLIR